MINKIQTNINLNRTGNLKFDIVDSSIYISTFDDIYEDEQKNKINKITTDFSSDLKKFYNRRNLTYVSKDGTISFPIEFHENLKYYKTTDFDKSLSIAVQFNLTDLPDYILILGNKQKKFHGNTNTLIPEDFKNSEIIYSFHVKDFINYILGSYTDKILSKEDFIQSSAMVDLYGIRPKTSNYETYKTSFLFDSTTTIDPGTGIVQKTFTQEDFNKQIQKYELISSNCFNFEIFFKDTNYDFDEYQYLLVKTEEICKFDIDYNTFAKRYKLNFNENNIINSKYLNNQIENEITLNVNYPTYEPILDIDHCYTIVDRYSSLISIQEKYFNLLVFNSSAFKIDKLFGNELTTQSVVGNMVENISIPSNLILTIDNELSRPFTNGCYLSISPGCVNNSMEYRIIARDDLDFIEYTPYLQNNIEFHFQTSQFELQDVSHRHQANSNTRDYIKYILSVEIDEYLEIDEFQPVKIYFGEINIESPIYNLRKNPRTNRTTFDLYDFGDSNFQKIDEHEYTNLKFSYKEPPYYFTYFNTKQKISDIVQSICDAFNSFEDIFFKAIPFKNNVMMVSQYENDSWNNFKFRYYFRPNSDIGNFKINGVPVQGKIIKDGNGDIIYQTKINEVEFSKPIIDSTVCYLDGEEASKVTEDSYLYTMVGKEKAASVNVDNQIALLKDINNTELIDKYIISIENNNDKMKNNSSNYVTLSNKYLPKILKILSIE